MLKSSDANQVKAPFTEEEIRWELMSADGNKASGLDDFTFKFSKCFG